MAVFSNALIRIFCINNCHQYKKGSTIENLSNVSKCFWCWYMPSLYTCLFPTARVDSLVGYHQTHSNSEKKQNCFLKYFIYTKTQGETRIHHKSIWEVWSNDWLRTSWRKSFYWYCYGSISSLIIHYKILTQLNKVFTIFFLCLQYLLQIRQCWRKYVYQLLFVSLHNSSAQWSLLGVNTFL